jgi:hypothetical protein
LFAEAADKEKDNATALARNGEPSACKPQQLQRTLTTKIPIALRRSFLTGCAILVGCCHDENLVVRQGSANKRRLLEL